LQDGIAFSERNFFKNLLSEEEIRELAGYASVSEIFSWHSPAVKKLGADPASMGDDGLIELMLKEPRLIRRPLFRVGAKLIIGASPDSLANL
jgi:arsenate reductase/regulatory protein spx